MVRRCACTWHIPQDIAQLQCRRCAVEAPAECTTRLAMHRRFQNSTEDCEAADTIGCARCSALQLHSSFGFALLVVFPPKRCSHDSQNITPCLFVYILNLLQNISAVLYDRGAPSDFTITSLSGSYMRSRNFFFSL